MMLRHHARRCETEETAADSSGPKDLNALTVSELKALLETRGLEPSGKKQELIKRLEQAK